MEVKPVVLQPALYLVSVPIGTARDITLRALDTLRSADSIWAEDTRSARRLLGIHGIPLNGRQIRSYNDANGAQRRPAILEQLRKGKSVCYVSESGTPLVADPGYKLVQEAVSMGIQVTTVPGATAAVAAVTVSGLPTDRFLFAGFLPATTAARQRELKELRDCKATLVIYETARRLQATLEDLAMVFGGARRVAVCRELTKKFEEIARGSLEEFTRDQCVSIAKGEIVLVIEGAAEPEVASAEVEALLSELLDSMTVRDAASEAAAVFGIPRSRAYKMAVSLAQLKSEGTGSPHAGTGKAAPM